jgi:hypothetical protein
MLVFSFERGKENLSTLNPKSGLLLCLRDLQIEPAWSFERLIKQRMLRCYGLAGRHCK